MRADQAACAVQARLLQAGAPVAHLGLGASLLAVALLPWAQAETAWLHAAVLLAGAAERVLALRLRLDAGLFADLAQGRIASLQALDDALQATGLRRAPGLPRALAPRLQGAQRLQRWHAGLVGLQCVLLAAAAAPR